MAPIVDLKELELDTRKSGNYRTSDSSKAREPDESGALGDSRYLEVAPSGLGKQTEMEVF